ncbi:MAG: hypothetical protein WA477_03635 [Candidatus Sulfotelmatobacter sp.]
MNAVEISTQAIVQQVVRNGGFELPCTADTAFPLFSPEGERLWIKEWNPIPIFPDTIEFRRDTVFRQGTGDGDAIWTIVDADWKSHRAEYVRVAAASHAARIVVKIDPAGPERCYVNAAFMVTAFADHGHSLLDSFSETAYSAKMLDWQRWIREYLDSDRPR